MRFVVEVGWASRRPPSDQHTSRVAIDAPDWVDAMLGAAQMVACRPECVMPTSTRIVDWEMPCGAR